MREFTLSRRGVLGAAALLAAPAIIRPARAAEQCVVGTWGGDYARLLRENIDDPILKPAGVQVVQDIGDETPRTSKMYAQKKLPHGTMDIACLGALWGYRVNEAELVEGLDEKTVPNLKHVLPDLRMPGFVPHIYSAQVLVYNPDTVKEPPQSMSDLLDPKWKGKVGVVATAGPWVLQAASLLESGTTTDFDKAKAFVAKLNDNGLRLYPETDNLAPAFKSGEIDVGMIWLARSFMWRNGGFPVAGQFSEGRLGPLRVGHGVAEERAGQGGGLQIHECAAGAVGSAGLCRAHGLSADRGQCAAVWQRRRAAVIAGAEAQAGHAGLCRAVEGAARSERLVVEERSARMSSAPSPQPPPARGGGAGYGGRGRLEPALMLGPASLLMVLLLLLPLALLFRDSLNRFDPTELMIEAVTPANYLRFFADPFYRAVLVTTIRVSLIVTTLCLVLGLPMAWRLARTTSRWKSALVVLMVLPLFVGSTTRTAGWMILFARGGMLDTLMGLNLMYAESAVIAGIVAINLPFTVLTLQSVFEGIDPRLEEAAASMGAAPSRAFWRVVFPLALPGIAIAAVLCFILCMNAFATPLLLGGPHFQMMAPLLFWAFSTDNNWPFAAAIAFILMVTTLLLTAAASHLIPRRYRI